MKALVCTSLGSYDALSVQEVADPTPANDEVLVDVVSAALNFPDILIVAGKYQIKPDLPFVAGGEAAGIVSEVGCDVTGVKPGDRVAVVGSVGAFAEKVIKKEHELIRIPDSMSFDIAAGFCVAYGTSYYALKQCGNVRKGESVLVLGAAGGVGLAAVDISRALGARVIAAASDDTKLAAAKSAGANDGIRYDRDSLKERTKLLTDGKGADVVFDPVGGDASEQALRAIAWNGRFLVIGFAAGKIPCVPLNLPLLKNCNICGVFFGAWAQRDMKSYNQNFDELFALFGKGSLHPVVSDSFALQDFRDAFATLSERRATGKVILRIRDEIQ
jgi:NADPH2:quinone reductase